VSALAAGCWTIGGPANNNGTPIGWDDVDPDAAYVAVITAHELGVTLYDTADVYGMGHSERLLGRFLATIDRATVTISSKVGYFAGTSRHPYDPAQIRRQFATTLDNLGTDHLDVYFLHSSDFGPGDQYLPAAMDTLRNLRDQGLITAIGIRAPHTFAEQWGAQPAHPRHADTRRFLDLFAQIQPDILTARFNLLSPRCTPDETDLFTFARRHGCGVLIKQALAQGRLLRRYDPATPLVFSSRDHRSRDEQFSTTALQQIQKKIAPLRERFGDDPASMARVALRYALQSAPDAAVLVGFRNPAQIRAAANSVADPLTSDEMAWIVSTLHTQHPSPTKDNLT
jgi:aryl-alcohol dehydrogenase-like predicted oxidoreductase